MKITVPGALSILATTTTVSVVAATLTPIAALAEEHSQSVPLIASNATDDGTSDTNTDVRTTTAATTNNDGADSTTASTSTPSDNADADSNADTILDSLDFAKIIADNDHFMVPQAAEAFKQADGTYRIGRPVAGGNGAGTIVPGLEEFYQQKLNWQPCDDFGPEPGSQYAHPGVECAYLIVPVDYAQPNGPTAAIGLYKVKATKPELKIGTIFQDPGGPGGSGMAAAASYAKEASGPLAERFDYIGFDPRGVSSSLPMIRCNSSDSFDKQRQDADAYTAEEKNAITKYNTNQCYENTGKLFGIDGKEFIAQVGTRNVVRDLDIARSVVGDAKINYLGYSYGTSIGYHYAKTFPDNIRTLVIDGVVNPFENNPEGGKAYAKYTESTSSDLNSELVQLQGFQSTFEQFLKQCATKDGFVVNGVHIPCATGTDPDPAAGLTEYQKIARTAWNNNALRTNDGRKVTFADITQATITAMYNEGYWPFLNLALNNLKKKQDARLAMRLADSYYNRGNDGSYGFDQAAFQTIWCTDYGITPGNNDPGAAEARLAKQYEIAPFTDPGVDEFGIQRGIRAEKDWCTYYGVTHTLPAGEDLFALPNILVISTTYDSATPYQDGVVAADAMNATLLTVAGSSHTSFSPGAGDCTAQITEKYFTDLIVPTNITGEQGVETKDIFSNIITGNECRVDSFRPKTVLENVRALHGNAVVIKASGLVRNTSYIVSFPAETGLSPVTAMSNADGIAHFEFVLDDKVATGEYDMTLSPADLTQNDPSVQASGKLLVASEELLLPESSDVVVEDLGSDTNTSKQPESENALAQGPQSQRTATVRPVDARSVDARPVNATPAIARTGANTSSVLLGAVGMSIVGLIVLQRRKKR